ncbi:hypothetical protein [Caulobacter mirabilis]|uniref:Uncharacterized protein n=1 Tax=Caulobacter mirabilis TaxID=69666 RepID=A0A2D2AZL9_9CAUL|nr:hypothetical protein [Caulobacter mirabilis]ATQ43458.1 hypothetical protein CSW64_14085 [Caulobacter mirabilis]
MNYIALLAASCATLALAACDHPDAARQRAEHALKTVTKLDCPEKQGALTRTSVAPDGQSCEYRADGSEVTLRIVQVVDRDSGAALKSIENELRPLVPKAGPDEAALKEGAKVEGENVDINLPGVSIQANDAGAKISAGGADINANDDGAEIRVSRNVEVDGKKIETERVTRRKKDDGVQAMLLLASDKPTPSGWGVVGYQARGPQGGPLVVGVVKLKENNKDGDDNIFGQVDELVRHNVGGKPIRGLKIN